MIGSQRVHNAEALTPRPRVTSSGHNSERRSRRSDSQHKTMTAMNGAHTGMRTDRIAFGALSRRAARPPRRTAPRS